MERRYELGQRLGVLEKQLEPLGDAEHFFLVRVSSKRRVPGRSIARHVVDQHLAGQRSGVGRALVGLPVDLAPEALDHRRGQLDVARPHTTRPERLHILSRKVQIFDVFDPRRVGKSPELGAEGAQNEQLRIAQLLAGEVAGHRQAYHAEHGHRPLVLTTKNLRDDLTLVDGGQVGLDERGSLQQEAAQRVALALFLARHQAQKCEAAEAEKSVC